MISSLNCELLLYADDSLIYTSGTTISELEKKLGENMISFGRWLVENKLTIYPSKFEYNL